MPRRHEIQLARSTAGRERSHITDQRNPLYNRPFNREQILFAKVSKTLTLLKLTRLYLSCEVFLIGILNMPPAYEKLSTAPDPYHKYKARSVDNGNTNIYTYSIDKGKQEIQE